MAGRIRFLFVISLVCLSIGAFGQKPDAKPADAKSGNAGPVVSDKPDDSAKYAGGELKGKIMLPSSGEWVWWVQCATARDPKTSAPVYAKGEYIDWVAEDASGVLYILNLKTGNYAGVRLGFAAMRDGKLADSDFALVNKLSVKITNKAGKPVKYASVTYKPEKRVHIDKSAIVRSSLQQNVIIDPSDNGMAVFRGVALGKATIVAGSGDVKITQEINIERERKTPVAMAEVILPGNVPVVESASSGKAGARQPRGSVAPPLVSVILSAVVIGLIACVLYLFAKNRQLSVKSMLEKAGIPVEEDLPAVVQAPEAPAVPPLDPNAIGPAPSAPVAQASTSGTSVSGPRLVGEAGTYAGAVFPISGHSVIIGRETTCDIALSQDTTASRRHARIGMSGGVYTLYDEGSSNGTFVGGQKIVEHQLGQGDEIQIGSTRFRFEV